jgi:ABC-2 type transport system permease protein
VPVYKQTYKDYSGTRTTPWFRFLILSRYSYARLFQSKFLVLFLAVCMFYPLGCAVFIYLSHNIPLLTALRLRSGAMPPIDGRFFDVYCVVQGALAFLLTTLVGPTLVAPDLANGAMSLYLSRPFSRTQYVAGKMTILLLLLSLITWIPGIVPAAQDGTGRVSMPGWPARLSLDFGSGQLFSRLSPWHSRPG